ncbi:hypothetical protein GRS66_011061 [Saccharomyces pastorianus]|uniref:Protein transport protein sec16 n=2 Tax=Saccharomyces pastorianus TaxID=27292 RepID=A0A6C1EHZ3_SACPS|nr:hypothetical protein GRS66_011061 [Saccharomyces pastorianus]
MTPEAKKRKNQKKKQKQRQKKAAEKAVHNKELHETPESTVSIDFDNDSVNPTGSDMTPESDVLPVSSSTNISNDNDTQPEVLEVKELHDELHDESCQHDITADTSDLANSSMIESNSSIIQTEPNVSQEDTKDSYGFPLNEMSFDEVAVESNDTNEHAQKTGISDMREESSSENNYEHYDSVIITSNDSTSSHPNHFLSSNGNILSPEVPSGNTPAQDISLDTTDSRKLECHYGDKDTSLQSSHELSEDLFEEEDDSLKQQAHVPPEEEKEDTTDEKDTDHLFGSDTVSFENVIKSSGDDASELFQDNENNEKLPWEEELSQSNGVEEQPFGQTMSGSQDVAEISERHNEVLSWDEESKESNGYMDNIQRDQQFEEGSEKSSEKISTQGSNIQNSYYADKLEIEDDKSADKGNSELPSASEGNIESDNDNRDGTGSLFAQSTERPEEVLPWEADDKNTEVTSESHENHEGLFASTDHYDKLPWEVSENQISSGNTENSMQASTEGIPEKKFSFLEEDDDLLDDDDSFLASSEEDNSVIDSSNIADLEVEPVEERRASKYEPSNEQHTKILQKQALLTNTAGIVTPQQFHGLAKSASNGPGRQTSIPSVVTPSPPVVKVNHSINKINEEKKKSDAYDFPLEIIPESSKKGHAKPVGVPTQRFGSAQSFSSLEKPIPQSRKSSPTINFGDPKRPPVIPLGTQVPRSSRTNSGASQSPLNYAFPNPYNLQQQQQPSSQPRVPLPNVNLPLPILQVETTASVPPIRARGISNASIGSTTSFGARRSTQYGVNTALSPVSPYGQAAINLPTANKYAPTSPATQQGQYPSIAQSLGGPVVNNPNFVKTHRGHTSSISYTPNQNEHASRYAPSNQQSYQTPHAPQPVAPGATNLNYQNQPRNSYVAPVIPNVQPVASMIPNVQSVAPMISNVQPVANMNAPMNTQPPMGPSATIQAPMNMQLHQIVENPANLPPPTNIPPIGITRQAMNNAPLVQKAKDVMVIDNEAILHRQFPVFHWSPANKVVYAVPSAPDQSQYMISSSSVQEIKVIPIDQIVKPNDMLKSFPGPLNTAKLKKKDLTKWIEITAKAISEKNQLADMTIWLLLEMKLSDTISWKNISNLLYNSDELSVYLSQPFPDSELVPNSYRLDVSCQMRVLAFLQTGNHDEALRLALSKRDYSIALLIGSLMGKDKWSEVIQKYLYEEYTTGPNHQKVMANFLFLIFQVFVGNSKMAVENFYANKEAGQWALGNWKSIVAAVLINIPANVEEATSIPPVVLEFLIEFGIFLTKKGMTLAAHTLFIIGNVPLSEQPVMADSDVVFHSIGNPSTVESVLWCEIYEYIFSCDSKLKGFPSILPQKVYHASILQEQGLTNLSTKYTDYLGSLMRKLPKKDVLTINLARDLNEIVTRLSESNTGWLAKPKLSSVWGQLDKSFNKYIGGDDIDALSKKNDKKKVFDGFTPGSSANSSTVDLTQTFTPFQTQGNSQSYVDTTALLHSAYNGPNHSLLHSKPPHGSKGLAEPNLPYVHRIGDSLQGSPQRVQSTQYASIDPQMTSLRRVRTDQHASEKAFEGLPISGQKLSSYAPQHGHNHSIPMEKSDSNATSMFTDFAPPPKFGRVSSNYMSSPDLIRRESIISTGSDFLPPPKVGAPVRNNSSQGSLMYSPSVEALPMEPLIPSDHEIPYNNSSSKRPDETTLDREYQTSENNSNTDQNTLKDFTGAAGETRGTEVPDLEDEKVPSTMETVSQHTSRTNPVQLAGEEAISKSLSHTQPVTEGSNEGTNVDNAIPSNDNGESGTGLPEHVTGPVSSTYLPSVKTVSEQNNLDSAPAIQEQIVAESVIITTPKPMEQHVSPPKLISTKATKMHSSPYMPQDLGTDVDTEVPTIPEASPAISVRAPLVRTSAASPYYPLANRANENALYGISETVSQSQVSNDVPTENRFSPIKKAEVVEREDFEPTIRKASANQYKAFKPLESEVKKYNDVIEEESDDENTSADDGKNTKDKKKNNDNAKKESNSRNDNIDDKSNSWFGWLKKDTGDKKVYKAKLGHKNTLYYDEKLKRWVNKDATEEDRQKIVETSAPPPPPIVKRKDAGPKTKPRSGPINNTVPPINATSVIPNNPITGEPLSIKSPPPLSSGGVNTENSPPPSSPISNTSGVNLTGRKANGLDDLLSLTGGPKPASTRRKKKSTRGYVNVMNNI